MGLSKYRLKDGSIYWHKLYFDLVPDWMCEKSPPFGAYNYAFYAYNPHKYISQLWDEVKYFIQRGRRGYSDRDAWSLDWYLMMWLPKALKQLKRTKHGHPCDLTEESWSKLLDQMIEGLEAERKWIAMEWESEQESTDLQKKGTEGLNLLVARFHDLWD